MMTTIKRDDRIYQSGPVDSITGWGLNNPNQQYFTLEDTGQELGSCISETCAHNSHSERGPVYQLVPKQGVQLELLGLNRNWDTRDRTYWEYYRVTAPDTVPLFMQIVDEFHYGVSAKMIEENEVPSEFDNGVIEPETIPGPELLPVEERRRLAQERRTARPLREPRPDSYRPLRPIRTRGGGNA